jgi:hypothetical protein
LAEQRALVLVFVAASDILQNCNFILIKCAKYFQAKPGEPLYAQVNREKKKNRQYEQQQYPDEQLAPGPGDMWGYEEQNPPKAPQGNGAAGVDPEAAGGDSWV